MVSQLQSFSFRVQKMTGLAVEIEADEPNRQVATAIWRVVVFVFHLLKGFVRRFIYLQFEDEHASGRVGDDVRLPVGLTVFRCATDSL